MSKRGKGEVCNYCKRTLESITSRSRLAATRDHVVPKSKGGRATIWCCRQCNSIKGDMDPDTWQSFMEANPEWWMIDRYRHHGQMHKQPTFYARNLDTTRYVLRGGFWIAK